jgi:DUF438 domain-containing protein
LSLDKKAQIKEVIRQLHDEVPTEQVKEKFNAVFNLKPSQSNRIFME